METVKRGLMLVLSSPSGAGKTTISKKLLAQLADLHVSLSATTRPQRPGEEDGKDYIFLEEPRFKELVKKEELLEYAYVFQNFYGTPRAPVEQALTAGKDVLFDIDWQGAQQLKLNARRDMVSVFVLPPSMTELHRRLIARGQDAKDTIDFRMQRALHEISHWGEYDYIIVNHDVDTSVHNIASILCAEKLRRSRQPEMTEFVRRLNIEASKS